MNAAATMQEEVKAVEPDYAAIKTRQQGAWSSGDYAVIGTTLRIIGEMLCEAVDRGRGHTAMMAQDGHRL